jgi:hypothetical protein
MIFVNECRAEVERLQQKLEQHLQTEPARKTSAEWFAWFSQRLTLQLQIGAATKAYASALLDYARATL